MAISDREIPRPTAYSHRVAGRRSIRSSRPGRRMPCCGCRRTAEAPTRRGRIPASATRGAPDSTPEPQPSSCSRPTPCGYRAASARAAEPLRCRTRRRPDPRDGRPPCPWEGPPAPAPMPCGMTARESPCGRIDRETAVLLAQGAVSGPVISTESSPNVSAVSRLTVKVHGTPGDRGGVQEVLSGRGRLGPCDRRRQCGSARARRKLHGICIGLERPKRECSRHANAPLFAASTEATPAVSPRTAARPVWRLRRNSRIEPLRTM